MINTIVEITVDCREWYRADNNIEGVCQKTITKVFENDIIPSRSSKREVGLLLTTNDRMLDLNKVYRKKNAPTNVLSFPNGLQRFDETPIFLGDIAIGYSVTLEESIEANLPFLNHMQHLLVHGCLHLLGFDHEETDEAEEMERVEIKILRDLDIEDPYDLSAHSNNKL
jgi:probable rRNA maturation factor